MLYNKATLEQHRVLESLKEWDSEICIVEVVERGEFDDLDKAVIESGKVPREAVERKIQRFSKAPARIVAWTTKKVKDHADIIFMRADAMYT